MKSFSLNHKILDLLINPADYAKHERKSPYILNVKNDVQEILLYGSNHSANWQASKFIEIKKLFKSFTERHEQHQVAAVVENIIPDRITSTKQMIQSHGESGYVCWLASRSKTKRICIEPTLKQLFDFINSRDHKKEDIALWLFLNYLINNTNKKKLTLNVDIAELETLIHKISKDTTVTLNYSQLAQHCNEIADKEILPQKISKLKGRKINLKKMKEIENPYSRKTAINKIGCDINLGRDYFMTNKILASLKKGYSVFGALGINHVISQEAVYQNYLKKKG